VPFVARDLEERVRRRVGDDERLAAREDVLDLGVLGEIDGEIAELLVVGRGDDVADVPLFATRSTRATSAIRWTTVKRMPRKSRFDASAWVSSSTSCASFSFFSSSSTARRRRIWPRMRATSSTGLNGFRTKSSAPLSNALAISSSASSAVRTTTGRSRVSARARRMRSTW